MRTDKEKIIELRRQGKSYRQIQKETGVSRATLCVWFKDMEWSKHSQKINTERHIKASTERMMKMNMVRKIKLDYIYAKAEDDATQEYQKNKLEPLFMAGLMVYAGEGDKRNRNITRISNSEFYLHKIFLAFTEKYLDIKRENAKIGLLLYSEHDQVQCMNMWSRELGIPIQNFHKNQVIQGKETKNKLQYGVGMSIISSTVRVKKKILKWLELCSKDF